MSRTPVREALSWLASDGLLVATKLGYKVPDFTRERLLNDLSRCACCSSRSPHGRRLRIRPRSGLPKCSARSRKTRPRTAKAPSLAVPPANVTFATTAQHPHSLLLALSNARRSFAAGDPLPHAQREGDPRVHHGPAVGRYLPDQGRRCRRGRADPTQHGEGLAKLMRETMFPELKEGRDRRGVITSRRPVIPLWPMVGAWILSENHWPPRRRVRGRLLPGIDALTGHAMLPFARALRMSAFDHRHHRIERLVEGRAGTERAGFARMAPLGNRSRFAGGCARRSTSRVVRPRLFGDLRRNARAVCPSAGMPLATATVGYLVSGAVPEERPTFDCSISLPTESPVIGSDRVQAAIDDKLLPDAQFDVGGAAQARCRRH